jgi:integral membrane protein
MTVFLAWRLAKLVALVLFAGGVIGSVARPDRAGRMRLAHGLATAGVVATWFAGFAMMRATGRSLHEPFILGAMVTSLGALGGALWHAHRGGRASAVLAVAGLFVAVAAMVARDAGPALRIALGLAGLAGGWGVVRALGPARDDGTPDLAQAWSWFAWVARVEGLTLVLMLFVSMPLRRVTGVALDGGTGLLGWTHGVMVFVYMLAMATAGPTLGWSARTYALGFVASLVPFGTFVFERRLKTQSPTSRLAMSTEAAGRAARG